MRVAVRLLFTLLTLLGLAPAISAQHPLKVGIYQNSPKLFVDAQGEPAGFFVDLLNTIARREGWQLDYIPCEWNQCLARLQQRELDIMPDVAYSHEREQRFDFTREAVLSSWSELYQPADGDIGSLLDLDGKRLVVLKESIQYQALKQLADDFGVSPRYIEVDAFPETVALVAQGEADGILFNRFYGMQNAAALGLQPTGVLVRPSLLKFAFPKGYSRQLIAAVDAQLLQLKQNHSSPYYAAIDRWLVDPRQVTANTSILWLKVGVVILLLLLSGLAWRSRNAMRAKIVQLNEVDRLLKSVINSTRDLIFYKDREGIYLGCNDAFAQFVGRPRSEIIGCRDQQLFSSGIADRLQQDQQHLLDTGDVIESELWLQGADGRRVLFDTLSTPLDNGRGEAFGVLGVSRDITERRRLESEIRDNEAHFRKLYEQAPLPYQSLDSKGVILNVNHAWLQMLGYQDESQVVGRNITEFLSGSSRELLQQRFPLFKEKGEVCCSEFEMLTRDGDRLMVVVDGTTRTNEQGEFLQTHCILTDITRQREVDERLRMFRRQIDQSRDAFFVINAKSAAILDANETACKMLGYERQVLLEMRVPDISCRAEQPGGWDRLAAMVQAKGHGLILEDNHRRKDGSCFPVEVSSRYIEDGGIGLFVASARDATERKAAEAELRQKEQTLEHLAHHDPLTGLPNRLLFSDRLNQALHMAHRNQSTMALLFIDLDHFKEINDSLGHGTGDQLLLQVSRRLTAAIREDDTISRLGGDEFTVITGPLSRPQDAAVVAQKLLDELATPFETGSRQLSVGASIGISLYPDDGDDAEVLLRNADAAMYRAKAEGRNHFQFYTEDMTSQAYQRVEMESALRNAISERQFILHYQPQIDITTGQLVGVEALIRWIHPQLGVVAPDRFIPLAERTDQILKIGEWVLYEVCNRMVAWQAAGQAPLRASVNVSGKQLVGGDRSLLQMVRGVLQQTGCDPECIELEITEGVVMANPQQSIEDLQQLRELGIHLAIDDFGTGYSSLNYLRLLPIDTLKIDRMFIQDVPGDANTEAISRAIIALGKALQLKVLAEGVENRSQLDFLQREGCDLVQGYYYSRPLPEQEFLAFLQQHR